MAAAPAPSTRRVDQIPGALDAVFGLLEPKRGTWGSELPHDTVPQKDPESTCVMNELFHPIIQKRSQLQLQHLRWRVLGKPVAMAAPSLSQAQIRAIIESRVSAAGGDIGVLQRAFTAVTESHALVKLRPEVMPPVVSALKIDARSAPYYVQRAGELKSSTVPWYARASSKVNSNSANPERSVPRSQQDLRSSWMGLDFAVAAFAHSAGASPSSMAAEGQEHPKWMTYKAFDDAIWFGLRRCFGPKAGLDALKIPPYSTEQSASVSETLYYIAGAMLSTLQRLSKRCEKTMANLSRALMAFVAKHTLRQDPATDQGPFSSGHISLKWQPTLRVPGFDVDSRGSRR